MLTVPGPSFDATRLTRLRSRINGYATDSLLNSRFQVAITAASWSAGSATLTAAGHQFVVGQTLTVAGMTPAGYNGTFTITGVTSSTFSYATSNPGAATVFGTANISLPCRVDENTRDEHLPGLGRMIISKRWRIVQAYGTPVEAGDILTVANKGTYCVLEVEQEKSVEVSASSLCFQQRRADGTLNLLANVTATFTRQSSLGESLTELVYIAPVSPDVKVQDQELLFEYLVCWDPLLIYPTSHDPISSGDEVEWPSNGLTKHATVRNAVDNLGPEIHFQAFLDDVTG